MSGSLILLMINVLGQAVVLMMPKDGLYCLDGEGTSYIGDSTLTKLLGNYKLYFLAIFFIKWH